MKRDTLVLAIGNAGGNIAGYIRKETKCMELKSCHFVSANADKETHSFGKLKTLGITTVHLKPNVYKIPAKILKNIGKMIIIVGLGGETGTEYIVPVIDQALNAGVTSIVAFLTLPFSFEGNNKLKQSIKVLSQLSEIQCVKPCALNNEHLLTNYPSSNIFSVLNEAEYLLMKYIERCVTEEITDYSPIQIDINQDPLKATWLRHTSNTNNKTCHTTLRNSLLPKLLKFIKNIFNANH